MSANRPKALQLPLFRTGQVVGTPGALLAAEQAGINLIDLLTRHVFGDWGDLCEEDRDANNQAVALGGRILSNYEIGAEANKTTIWLITEADRSSTCALLPREY